MAIENYILENNEWVLGDLVHGQPYRIVNTNGGAIREGNIYVGEIVKPIIPITNLTITGSTVKNNIHWVKAGTEHTLTADVSLPDDTLMVMVEQVVEQARVINDERFVATISNGVLSMPFMFDNKGNYVVTQERMNKALDYINKPIHFSFDKIELNVHY